TIDTNDRRAYLIALTPLGRETIEKILPDHYDQVGEIFSVLSSEEQDQLAEILKKFKNQQN
ncbi:MarR family winged helix-turn-helix transcriptional regulator, partial [Streptococcus suis]